MYVCLSEGRKVRLRLTDLSVKTAAEPLGRGFGVSGFRGVGVCSLSGQHGSENPVLGCWVLVATIALVVLGTSG